MAARSRPRGGQRTDEYDEERVIWNSIKQDGRRVDQLMVRHILFLVVIIFVSFNICICIAIIFLSINYERVAASLKDFRITTGLHPSMLGIVTGSLQMSWPYGRRSWKRAVASTLASYST
jgi:chromate transport protein ChrA